ncbi:GFA family protein [Maribellus sp. YY47]|uniref:GFA family protein n=1 Tax=Maribellus sp. YY47 TaxID=2929486 RepID=UPI002000E86A|nr:GFA family protein [Maribellus sp. YY47]MCK3684797.1 GFA family protein [Maribellus sp. YY47]
MIHSGSCLCKKVVFEVNGDFDDFFLCHCKWCRKDTGSAHAANLFSSTAKIRWISGEDQVRSYQHKTTQHVKAFCVHCGSALPNLQMDGALLVVPAGSLNTDIPIQPKGHIFLDYKANWDKDMEKIPRYEKLPG